MNHDHWSWVCVIFFIYYDENCTLEYIENWDEID